ncbi:MAG: hypothetical protein ACM3X7_05260 [Solirubrobacterales bacterium]
MGILAIIFYAIGIFITYFIIKLAVRDAIRESSYNIENAIVRALETYEHEKRNKE